MAPDEYAFPAAVSQLGENDSREGQNRRAIAWLLAQSGRDIVIVTPQKRFDGDSLKQLLTRPGVTHSTWRAPAQTLSGRRVIHAWPDRKHLNDLWGVTFDAIVVIEWGAKETASWIEQARAARLLPGSTVLPVGGPDYSEPLRPLPNGVGEILEHIADMAAGYDSGLKWNEEDKLKADMMNHPERWEPVTVEQVRAKCRQLKMRPSEVDTIAGFLERRKQGRRFNVRSSYRDFRFTVGGPAAPTEPTAD